MKILRPIRNTTFIHLQDGHKRPGLWEEGHESEDIAQNVADQDQVGTVVVVLGNLVEAEN